MFTCNSKSDRVLFMYVCMYVSMYACTYVRTFIDRILQQINLVHKNFTYKMYKRLWCTFLILNFKIKKSSKKKKLYLFNNHEGISNKYKQQ